ncbi:MAG: tetratricopeptide repeat protein [Saprospiraceae bacterium]|nr:tetratricopeptide repeat protein [Saprospiraceae bacterium]
MFVNKSSFLFFAFSLILFFSACVTKRKKGDSSALGRFYHNTTAKYNAWFNANEILKTSLLNFERNHKDNYSEILPVFPYNAIANPDSEKPNLDKAILKVSTDISMHRISRWTDDCYFILAKSQYLKKDYETAEETYKFLLEEYSPASIIRNTKKLKEKSKLDLKKEKQRKLEEKKEAAEALKKEKAKSSKAKSKAKQQAKKKAQAKKKKGKTAAKPKVNQVPASSKKADTNPVVKKSEDRALAPITEIKKTEKTPNLKNVGSKLVPHRPVYWEASIWSAKNLIERAKYYEAASILKEIDSDANTPEYLYEDLNATFAHVYLRQNKYEQAIPYLKNAIEFGKSKKRKARYAFILGQLYQRFNRPVSSDEYFGMVLKMNPGYELRFQSKMNLLLNQGLGTDNVAETEKSILKLLKDPKNKDFEPEIYFALGQIALRANRREEGINYLKQCVSAQATNNGIKSNAYQVLADLHFESQQYGLSKNYFDSTLLLLAKNDPRRAYPSKMVANLSEIATQLDIIYLQDSLIKIAGLSTKEKRALAIQIKNRNKPKTVNPTGAGGSMIPENAFDKMGIGSSGFGERFDRSLVGQSDANAGGKDGKSSSYFAYDQRALNKGRSTFEQVWGVRNLEDNWRRSNKSSFVSEFESITQGSDDKAGENLEEDLANILRGIPTTEQELDAAHKKIQEAMFKLGVLYREKIEQYKKSKETHQDLLTRYPTFDRREDALYYIYLNCVELNERECADWASNELQTQYKNSRYTRILTDPAFARSLGQKKDELVESYHQAYKLYDEKAFESSFQILNIIKAGNRSPHPIDPKIQMLYALCIAKVSGKDAYMEELKNLIAQYPSTPEESKAKEIMRFLKGDEEAFGTVSITEAKKIDFKQEDNKTHFVFLIFFNPPERQMDKSKIALSDYHAKYHKLDNLKMTSLEFDKDKNTSLILIRQFENKSAAMKYIASAQRNQAEYIPGVSNYELYTSTQANYRLILENRSLKEYQEFFKQNYVQ